MAEMMLVVAILTVIMAIGVPSYLALSNSNQLDSATSILAQDLYQAQTYSRSQNQDSQWGVAVNGQTITLFSGSSYATRNTGQDVDYVVPTAVTLSGTTQIVYSKLYGLPQTTGTFTMTGGGKTSSVVVNSKGMLEY
jgi:Tfp pilus assembly protein FimT